MIITFDKYQNELDIKKLASLKVILLADFDTQFQGRVEFPSGNTKIDAIYGSIHDFENLTKFYMHIISMQYAGINKFELPSFFYESSFVFKELSYGDFKEYIDALYYAFFSYQFEYANDLRLLKIESNLDGFIEGYKIEVTGTSQLLICRLDQYFIYFDSISID